LKKREKRAVWVSMAEWLRRASLGRDPKLGMRSSRSVIIWGSITVVVEV
jgi:hypothetical protein